MLARTAILRVDAFFSPRHISIIAWAFVKAVQEDKALFKASAMAATPGLSKFDTQAISNTAWAFAKAGQRDETLFVAFARAAKPRLGEFNA